MATSQTMQDLNAELARRINEEARNDPNSSYRGKFVGIANGQVVGIADNLDDAMKAICRVEPDPAKTFCLQAGLDENETYEV
jgi:hypothetical protein